jgi:K+-sensing histidine kinase KdpD
VEERPSAIAYALGGLLPIAVAGAMVGLRSELDDTNVALVLVLVVVGTGALGGRGPAALSAVISAVSFNFFFTEPYYSLRVDESNDVETVLILLAIGLAVGQLAVAAQRSRRQVRQGRGELASMRRVAEQVAGGASREQLITLVVAELREMLGLVGCRFEPGPSESDLPVLERSGRIETSYRMVGPDGELAFPALGVRLPVVAGGVEIGSLMLEPDPALGVTVEARLVAVALADQLGAALAARLTS